MPHPVPVLSEEDLYGFYLFLNLLKLCIYEKFSYLATLQPCNLATLVFGY